MAKSDVRIDILGTSFTISAGEKPEYLQYLLEKYRRTVKNVQQKSGLKDPLKTAILTGFLLCDDLEKTAALSMAQDTDKAAGGTESNSGEAEKLTLDLISRLDELDFLAVDNTEDNFAQDIAKGSTGKDPSRRIFKLKNAIKNYDWGSAEWIPSLLGQKNISRVPWAEMWMGVNPLGPSRLVSFFPENSTEEEGMLLSELIDMEKETVLGKDLAERYGKLPFLFKVEAAAKPLSIQAHPDSLKAREGFDRENREGIPLDAPNRNYRDPGHKPEIICALGPFAALCGFRAAEEITCLFEELLQGFPPPGEALAGKILKDCLETAVKALKKEGDMPHRAFLSALFDIGRQPLEALAPFIKANAAMLTKDFPEHRDEWQLCSYLAGLFPNDSGILSPLYLNIIELAPGEAMFLPAGVFHAYIHGLGIELMADSDSVLRGGLSSKHVDQKELFRILSFREYNPEIYQVPQPAPELYTFPSPTDEFALSVLHGTGEDLVYPETGPSIILLTQGSAKISLQINDSIKGGNTDDLADDTDATPWEEIEKGQSVFISAGMMRIVLKGTFTAYAASAGKLPGAHPS